MVNRFFSKQMRYEEDIDLWHEVDQWATPIESLIKGGGIAKTTPSPSTSDLDVWACPSEKLLITYVKAQRLNRAHIVLTYYASPNAMPLVLDSLIDTIKPASERPDLCRFKPPTVKTVDARCAGQQKSRRYERLSRWQYLLKKMTDEGFPTEPEYQEFRCPCSNNY